MTRNSEIKLLMPPLFFNTGNFAEFGE